MKEKPPAPALVEAVEEIEIPAGLPALAYKVRNMAYVLANLFQHLECETRIHVDGIRAMYDMVERKAALLQVMEGMKEALKKIGLKEKLHSWSCSRMF